MKKKRKNSRARGQRGEYQARDEFKAWWGGVFTKTPGSGAFATITNRRDLNVSGDVSSDDPSFPWCIEVKYVENWDFIKTLKGQGVVFAEWWQQTINQCDDGKQPILLFRKNRQPWFYMLYPMENQELKPNMFAAIDQFGKMVYIGLFEDLAKTDPDDWRIANEAEPT